MSIDFIRRAARIALTDVCDMLLDRRCSGCGGSAPRDGEICTAPVALHPARRAWRGYDQALLLAREASVRWGVPVVEALVRVRDHPPQARLDPERRRTNVKGAFRVAAKTLIEGRPCLLLDDVATTGSTLL